MNLRKRLGFLSLAFTLSLSNMSYAAGDDLETLAAKALASAVAEESQSSARDEFHKRMYEALKQADLSGDRLRYADLLVLEADTNMQLHTIDEDKFKKAIAIYEKQKGKTVGLTRALNRLAIAQGKSNKGKEAEYNLLRSLHLTESGTEAQAADLVDCLDRASNFGLVDRSATAKYTVYSQTFDWISKKYPARKDWQATLLKDQAMCRSYVDTPNAIPLAEQAAKLAEQSGSKLLIGRCYALLGTIQASWNKPKEAVVSFEKALSAPLTLRERDAVLGKLSDAWANQQNDEKAAVYKDQQLAQWEKYPGPSKLNLINCLSNQVSFFEARNMLPRAIAYQERYVKLHDDFNPADHSPSDRLALMYVRAKQWQKARPLLEAQLTRQNERARGYGKDYMDFEGAEILINLAQCQTQLKDFTAARASLDRANATYSGRPTIALLSAYVEFFKAAGKSGEAQSYQAKLQEAQRREAEQCLACGRG